MAKLNEWLMRTDDLPNAAEAFAREHCGAFQSCCDDSSDAAANGVEHMALYKQYQAVIEAQLDAFLAQHGVSQEAFVAALQQHAVEHGPDSVSAADFVVAVTDYDEFKRLMVAACKQRSV